MGKSFCKECIGKIKARSQPCPTCKQDKFESFPNKGLQQPLYGFAVFCSNKERGCVWEGELGQLDQHINSSPDKEKQLVSHLTDNLVTHMSLLAMENRKLKEQLQKQEEKTISVNGKLQKQEENVAKLESQVQKLSDTVHKQAGELKLASESKLPDPTFCLPPVDVSCPVKFLHERRVWSSEPIHVYIAGSRMQLVLRVGFAFKSIDWIAVEKVQNLVQAQPAAQCKEKVAVILVDQENGSRNEIFELNVNRKDTNTDKKVYLDRHVKNDQLVFSITDQKDVSNWSMAMVVS